jgi:starvation-inducible DNA-binding protein
MTKHNTNPAVTEALSRVLADSFTLYLKTQNYHWNVTGPHFAGLHTLFQAQYEDLAAANDEIAERIRALGVKAPGSFSAFAKLAAVTEEKGAPGWQDMIKNLSADQAVIAGTVQSALKTADDVGDDATVDLMVRRLAQHNKNKWMLDALLAG